MRFSPKDKIESACKFILTLHKTAGCSAEEIKRLLHPKIIDEVVALAERRRIEGEVK